MRQVKEDLSNNMEGAESGMLDHVFIGIDNFRQEFPTIYKDIEQKKTQNSAMLKSTTINIESNTEWQDFEKIRMIYCRKEKNLRIKGRVHKTVKADYVLAQMTIKNKHGIINRYNYTITKSTFLLIDEELTVKPDDLDGIHAEMKYIFKSVRFPVCLSDRGVETSRIEEVGIDIIGKGKVLHPVSKHGHNKINIIYWRKDTNRTADYHYNNTYRLKDNHGRFYIHLPIAVQFQLDAGFELSDTPNIMGDIYIYSKNHGTVSFSNRGQVKMLPVSQWKNVAKIYPEIKEKFDSGYLFVLPQEWNSLIEKDGIAGEDDFYLSLDIQFTCRDGKRYSLEIDSRLNPKAYSGGARVEIPCFHLLWGCIEKDAEIEVLGKGRVSVSKVQIGEKVLSKDNTYETVCDILMGDEEILRYVRVNGRELMVTMDHPVMTKEGWKPARELREGEQILLQDGNLYPVQEIYDEPYYDKVYSLNLEKGEGFFANQIYVGDFKMQNSFKEEDIEIPQEIMDELEKFKNL